MSSVWLVTMQNKINKYFATATNKNIHKATGKKYDIYMYEHYNHNGDCITVWQRTEGMME